MNARGPGRGVLRQLVGYSNLNPGNRGDPNFHTQTEVTPGRASSGYSRLSLGWKLKRKHGRAKFSRLAFPSILIGPTYDLEGTLGSRVNVKLIGQRNRLDLAVCREAQPHPFVDADG